MLKATGKTNRTAITAFALASGLLVSTGLLAEDQAKHTAGITLGPVGLGVTASGSTDFSFIADDQIQWRTGISYINADFDDDDDIEIAGIDYEGDITATEFRGGIDWYPFGDTGWSRKVFFSGGLSVSDGELDAKADTDRRFKVGDTTVNPGDITSLRVETDGTQAMPYLSVGWGNKIDGKPGFDFQAEVGFRVPTRDYDVTLTAVDPNNVISAEDLAKERRQIEDDINQDILPFAMIGVTYHF